MLDIYSNNAGTGDRLKFTGDDKKKIILLISVKRREINSNRGYYYRFYGTHI